MSSPWMLTGTGGQRLPRRKLMWRRFRWHHSTKSWFSSLNTWNIPCLSFFHVFFGISDTWLTGQWWNEIKSESNAKKLQERCPCSTGCNSSLVIAKAQARSATAAQPAPFDMNGPRQRRHPAEEHLCRLASSGMGEHNMLGHTRTKEHAQTPRNKYNAHTNKWHAYRTSEEMQQLERQKYFVSFLMWFRNVRRVKCIIQASPVLSQKMNL